MTECLTFLGLEGTFGIENGIPAEPVGSVGIETGRLLERVETFEIAIGGPVKPDGSGGMESGGLTGRDEAGGTDGVSRQRLADESNSGTIARLRGCAVARLRNFFPSDACGK